MVATVRAAGEGLLVPADVVHRVSQAHRIAREEIFGPVLSVLTFRTPAEAVEKANNTPYGLSGRSLDGQGVADLVDGLPAAGRGGCGPTRSTSSIRPRRSAAIRNPVMAGKAAGTDWRLTSMSDPAAARVAVRKTYKLYIGGAFPRSESGRSYLVTDHKGRFLANAAMGSRKDARTRSRPRARPFAGWSAATAYNRGQVLYRVAELLEGRRAQFVAEVRTAEGLGSRQAEAVVDAAIDRWVWVRRLGGQDRSGARRGQPGWLGPTSTSRCPSRPGWWR